jgi:phosphatidylinositol dimannoside acyltransferase
VFESIADLSYAAGWRAVRWLPEPVANRAFASLADEIHRRRGPGIIQLEKNLKRVVPDASTAELADLSRESMRSYLRYWCETFRLPSWNREEILRRMVVHDGERFFDYGARDRGLIATLGHFGNWDHCGAWATVVGKPLTTVVERLRPEPLFDRFVAYRESLGMEVVPLTGGGNVTDILRERLVDNRFVCLVSDRELGKGGITVDLLGEPARFPTGPALLAVRTDSTLLPALSYYSEDKTHLQFQPELVPPEDATLREKVQALTQQYADFIGTAARAHPTDWHMLQPIWEADRRSS